MNQQESTRAVIVSGLRAGMTVKEIMDFASIKKSTVYEVKKKYNKFIASGGSPDTFEIARKIHKRRSDFMGTALAEDLRELVSKDPGRSMRSMAQEMNVSRTTVRKMVSEDLRYKSYAMRRG
jgi:transposase